MLWLASAGVPIQLIVAVLPHPYGTLTCVITAIRGKPPFTEDAHTCINNACMFTPLRLPVFWRQNFSTCVIDTNACQGCGFFNSFWLFAALEVEKNGLYSPNWMLHWLTNSKVLASAYESGALFLYCPYQWRGISWYWTCRHRKHFLPSLNNSSLSFWHWWSILAYIQVEHLAQHNKN